MAVNRYAPLASRQVKFAKFAVFQDSPCATLPYYNKEYYQISLVPIVKSVTQDVEGR